MKKYYVKRDFLKGEAERTVYDEMGKVLFKLWRDATIKMGEMGAIVMTLQDEELYTIVEKKMTCLVYQGECLIAECIGGSNQPHLRIFRRIYRINKDGIDYQLKGNWFGFDFTNEQTLIDIGRLKEIRILDKERVVGLIRFTEDHQYELGLESGEDGAFWIAVLSWIDYQLSVGNNRRW